MVIDGVCPECAHVWSHHPGALLSVRHCVDCLGEEECGARDLADMCARVPPGSERVPAGESLFARYERRPLRGDRVLIEDHRGVRWALLRPRVRGPEEVEALLQQVRSDLAVMPITQFWAKYDPLMQ